ncbi:MAG: 50S ribosomal protein L15 [Dehalococcoidia bacterium]|nr:50S ribosomal protein L15 [Dehalococcoidia bacterium]
MDQHTLRQGEGAKRDRKRVGRGPGSGTGTYGGRGRKGQKARGSVRPGFEGGQIPLVRRVPHLRGFRNHNRVEFQAVNLGTLAERFPAGALVDGASLAALRLIDHAEAPFKVLNRGELHHALTVHATRISSAARAAIEGAGGTVQELAPADRTPRDRVHRRKAAAAAPAAPAVGA